MLLDATEDIQITGLKAIREATVKSLTIEGSFIKLVETLFEMGVYSTLVTYLKDNHKSPEVLYECTWILINTSYDEASKVKALVDLGLVESLVQLINTIASVNEPKEKLVEVGFQCTWIIGNIAAESMEFRDVCLEQDAANRIVAFIKKHSCENQRLYKIAIWALNRLVDFKPAPFWNQISDVLPAFISQLEKEAPKGVIKCSMWGIYYISNSFLLNVYESGCTPLIIKYLKGTNVKVTLPALKILGNMIASSRDNLTDEVLKNDDFLQRLFELCTDSNNSIKVYAGWILSNIAAGSSDQIAKLLEKPKYFETLGDYLNNTDPKLKFQASCAVANLVSRATAAQIEDLVQNRNYLDYLSSIMKEPNMKIYERNLIEPINKILKADTSKKLVPIFKNKGLLEQIKGISGGLGFEMRTLAEGMIRQYFSNGNATTTDNAIPVATVNIIPVASPPAIVSSVPRASTSKKIRKAAKPSKQAPSPKQKKVQIQIQKQTSPTARRTATRLAKNSKDARRLKRTKSMKRVIEEAEELIEGVTSRLRQRKAKVEVPSKMKKANAKSKVKDVKKADEEKKEEEDEVKDDRKGSCLLGESKKIVKKSKIKRTNSMKQTLKESKKILKLIDWEIETADKRKRSLKV